MYLLVLLLDRAEYSTVFLVFDMPIIVICKNFIFICDGHKMTINLMTHATLFPVIVTF